MPAIFQARKEQLAMRRDIIVMGAPLGGGAALVRVASALPVDLPAALFVVLHTTPERPLLLADVLSAPGRLRAAQAQDGEPVEPRRIYVAAPDMHLLIEPGRVRLAPNGEPCRYRPAIDRLFRSAAEAYGARVIGVILIHAQEDGALGLHTIRQSGGMAVTHQNELMMEPLRHPRTGEEISHHHLELGEIARHLVRCAGSGEENDAL